MLNELELNAVAFNDIAYVQSGGTQIVELPAIVSTAVMRQFSLVPGAVTMVLPKIASTNTFPQQRFLTYAKLPLIASTAVLYPFTAVKLNVQPSFWSQEAAPLGAGWTLSPNLTGAAWQPAQPERAKWEVRG